MKKRLQEVHSFWFGQSEDDLEVIRQKGKLWFAKDEQVDQFIRETFSDLMQLASREQISLKPLSPSLQLAVILLLDQFSRNVYRNDPRSFVSDPVARKLVQQLMPLAEALRPVEKVFLYLPLEHSENLDDQRKSVALFLQLSESVDDRLKDAFVGFFDYAVRHHDIIVRFGRFPHRNKVLGRTSSAEELRFLLQPGSSF
ncbi:DUF924 family protein [Geopsychrobacter electrodiphilus]|uniref:DUF924 family protein n=1 Tax=Geopsychrobacter electrodiphilus TaxID=225196 RepID=UPI00036406A5|nr:DUF924 family protein [Geopsychrobacter electrodiphilus]